MDQIYFEGLKIGLVVKNTKTSKNWMLTDFVISYSSVKKPSPDQHEVRLSNGMGKSIVVSVDKLRKNYTW